MSEGLGMGAGGAAGAVSAGAGLGGCFSRCHASHSRNTESEKTIKRMTRCVSIRQEAFLGDRVDAASTPGMATQKPAQREAPAAQSPMTLHGGDRVLRAAGIEATTRGDDRAQTQAIPLNE